MSRLRVLRAELSALRTGYAEARDLGAGRVMSLLIAVIVGFEVRSEVDVPETEGEG